MKRGRPQNEHGAKRIREGKAQRWTVSPSGKGRWVSEDYYLRVNPQPEPAPEPAPEAAPDPAPEPKHSEAPEVDLMADLEGMASIFEELPDEETEEAEPPGYDDLDESGSSVPGIKGQHLLAIVDLIGSMAAAFILKKAKISNQPRSDFKLTSEEREELAEAAQACADTLKFNVDNPWASLGLGYFALISLKVKRNG